jgi:sterol desaturase/sphingolipid hydroxylase (fatty acid hydroxylase superfamily)
MNPAWYAVAIGLSAMAMALCQVMHDGMPRLRRAPSDGVLINGRYWNVALNGSAALATYAVAIVLFGGHLIDADRASRWYAPILVLLLYDFGYYWLHRALHWRPLMRTVHRVHHRTTHPTAVDSLYTHPLETVAGMAVLVASMLAVGPLGAGAFIAAAIVHSLVNVLVHANLSIPARLAWLTNHWSARHDAHHSASGNFATITPLWDWVFGTSARTQHT